MRSNRLKFEHDLNLEHDTTAVWNLAVEVEVSQKNIARYLASKEQLSIFQNHVNGTLFGCWVTRLLFCLNHFMLIKFDNEVWLCRYYPLTLDNIFKLSFIIVVLAFCITWTILLSGIKLLTFSYFYFTLVKIHSWNIRKF